MGQDGSKSKRGGGGNGGGGRAIKVIELPISDPQFRPGPGEGGIASPTGSPMKGGKPVGQQQQQQQQSQQPHHPRAGARHLDAAPTASPSQGTRAKVAPANPTKPQEPSEFNRLPLAPRHIEKFPIGVRVVRECDEFDSSRATIEKVFAPVKVPPGVISGATVLDRFTGQHAIVCGCVKLREKAHVLYMHVDGHRGATPFVTDGAFLNRWMVVEKHSLPVGVTFIVPPLGHLLNNKFYFSGLIAPVPVDVSNLHHLGLETGMLCVGGHGVPQTLRLLGLVAVGTNELRILFQNVHTGAPYAANRGDTFTIHSYRKVRTLVGSKSTYRAVDVIQQEAREDVDPLVCDQLFRVDAFSVAAFDTNEERCQAYYTVKPGEVINQQKIIIGLKYDAPLPDSPYFGKVQRLVNLYAMKIDSHQVELVSPGATVMVTGWQPPRQSAAPLRPSLRRDHPTSRQIPLVIPALPQDPKEYKFDFLYPHAARMLVMLDTKSMEKHLDLETGTRLLEPSTGKFLTAVGIGINHQDGVIELMVEADGGTGVVPAPSGIEIVKFEEVVRIREASKAQTYIYSPADVRVDVRVRPTKFYPLGSQAWVEGVDADPARCSAYFGLVPGQRLCGSLTAIGMQRIGEKVHMFFHEDGLSGAEMTKADDSVVQMYYVPEDIVEVNWVSGRTLKYEPRLMDYSLPWEATVGYKFGSELATVELIDADPKRCKKYFGLAPGQRLGGRITFVGMVLVDDELYIAGHKEGEKVAKPFSKPSDIFVFDDVVPIQLEPVDPKTVQVVVYNPAPVDPRHPIKPDFPALIGPGESPVIGLLDVNPTRCKRYFGIEPGTRVNSVATCAGMIREEDRDLVVLLFFIDGAKGAGSFDPGARLELDGEIRQIFPLELEVPIPTGPSNEVQIPPLPNDRRYYNFSFPAVVPGGIKVALDTVFLEINFGIVHGQRAKVGGEYCSYAGVGETPKGFLCFFKKDDGPECLGVVPGVSVRLYDLVVPLRPFISRTIIYYDKPLTHKLPPPVNSIPCKVQIAEQSMELPLDTDPRRCYLYFGIVPGQRVDGKYVAVGMGVFEERVKYFFRPETIGGGQTLKDETAGAFPMPDGTELELEQMDPQRMEELERDAAAFRQSGDDRGLAVKYQQTAEARKEKFQSVHSNFEESAQFPHHTKNQKEALGRVVQASRQIDNSQSVYNKLRGAGFSNPAETLERIKDFVAGECALCSWFTPMKMIAGKPTIELLTEDIAMRNLFEVGAGNACEHQKARKSWETRIFHGVYDDAEGWEKVKYGVCNIWNDPTGPRCPGDQYGDCFFVFAGLRGQTSMTPRDSSLVSNVATLTEDGGLVNILDEFDEEGNTRELESLAQLATGQVASATSVQTVYKEIQIHGYIFLEQHISHVVIAPHYVDRPADLHLLLNFCKKNACFLITTNTTKALVSMRLWSLERLAQFVVANQIDLPLTKTFSKPQLLSGPQTSEQRALYEVISDYMCMQEMSELREIAEKSQFSEWKPQIDLGGK